MKYLWLLLGLVPCLTLVSAEHSYRDTLYDTTLTNSRPITWTLIETLFEQVDISLTDNILEIKTNQQEEHGPYMQIQLFRRNIPIGLSNILWSGERSETGKDLLNLNCDTNYFKYTSRPCEGAASQVWRWEVDPGEGIRLSCNGEVVYDRRIGEEDEEECRDLVSVPVTRVELVGMRRFHYRILSKEQGMNYLEQAVEPTQEIYTMADFDNLVGRYFASAGSSVGPWIKINSDYEKADFDLEMNVLEIKSTRHQNPDDPELPARGAVVDKDYAMLLKFLDFDRPVTKIPFLWSTIKTKTGHDVHNGPCTPTKFASYESDPCEGEEQQIWAWHIDTERITLSCNGDVQYEYLIENSASEDCRRLASWPGNGLIFQNMRGFYYRSSSKSEELLLAPQTGTSSSDEVSETGSVSDSGSSSRSGSSSGSSTNSEYNPETDSNSVSESNSVDGSDTNSEFNSDSSSSTSSSSGTSPDSSTRLDKEVESEDDAENLQNDTEDPQLDNLESRIYLPTCNCWSKECDYCSNMDCAVKHDLTNSTLPLSVTSTVDDTILNSIVLFNTDGVELGKFQWNKRGIYLTGCVACRTPRRLVRRQDSGDRYTWSFTLIGGLVELRVLSRTQSGVLESVYTTQLIGECARHYQQVSYFSFYRMGCDNTFSLVEGMVAGRRVGATCGGQCEGVTPPAGLALPPQPEWSCMESGVFVCK